MIDPLELKIIILAPGDAPMATKWIVPKALCFALSAGGMAHIVARGETPGKK